MKNQTSTLPTKSSSLGMSLKLKSLPTILKTMLLRRVFQIQIKYLGLIVVARLYSKAEWIDFKIYISTSKNYDLGFGDLKEGLV